MTKFTFEPLREEHLALLHQWLQEPHVRAFWDDGHRTLKDVKRHYFERQEVKSWICSIDESRSAYLQIYAIDPQHPFGPWRSQRDPTLGFDFFIGDPHFVGKGLAAPLVESFIEQMVELPCRLLVDPDKGNDRALKVYEKVGFKPIGELQKFKILKKDISCVQIVPYDPLWKKKFEDEAKRIGQAIECVQLHHFGSTAVPGLSAKPKVDILAVVKSFTLLDISALVNLGYEVRREAVPTGKYFVKEQPRIHLHVFEEGNPIIAKNLMFRDWLYAHPEDREAYAVLKKSLAVKFEAHNGMAYCRAKTEFIEKIIKKARGGK